MDGNLTPDMSVNIGHHHDDTIKGLIVFVMKDVKEEPLNQICFSSLFKKVARLGDRNAFLTNKLSFNHLMLFSFPWQLVSVLLHSFRGKSSNVVSSVFFTSVGVHWSVQKKQSSWQLGATKKEMFTVWLGLNRQKTNYTVWIQTDQTNHTLPPEENRYMKPQGFPSLIWENQVIHELCCDESSCWLLWDLKRLSERTEFWIFH